MDNHPENQSGRSSLRQEMLARRDKLSDQERREKGLAMASRLQGLDCYAQARAILFFVSFRSEIDTLFLMDQALGRGVEVAVPLTVTSDKALKIFAITDLEADLVSGYQGILEPNQQHCRELSPSVLDIVVVPGSVFDRHGGRMGYGGGYYDRFLAKKAPQATRLGVCFDLQLVEKVPMAAHDQYLDYVITESQTIETGRVR